MSVTQLALVESSPESPATRAKRLMLESHEAAAMAPTWRIASCR